MSWISSFHDHLLEKTLLARKDPQQIMDDVDFLERILHLQKGNKVLDQCCGNGIIALELAKRGYFVQGVDITPSYIESAQNNASQSDADVHFICSDAGLYQSFDCDAVFNWWTGFGYFDDDEQNTALIDAAYHSLCSGGLYLLDIPNYNGVLRHFKPTMVDTYHTDIGLIELTRHTEFDVYRGRMEKLWEYRCEKELLATHHSSVRIYTSHEIVDFFTKAGFINIKLLGNQQGESLHLDHLRCMCIGEKA